MQLSTSVKEILKMIRASFPATIEIVKNIKDEQYLIFANATQVHQIVANLCTNAFQAMEHGGGSLCVSLSREVVSVVDFEKHPNALEGEYLLLSISDTGKGIDPKNLDKIFEPYFTTKGVGKGTGMGLAIVHGIIASYNGFIEVRSELGAGTTFDVYFPIWRGEVIDDKKEVDVLANGSEKILLVDDELIKVETDILEFLGYDVTAMTSSLEAWDIFRENPDSFDLVITDQTMPNMTGAELSQKILELRPNLPIIICTGHSSIIDETTAKEIGIREFILKPIVIADISRIIRRILDEGK